MNKETQFLILGGLGEIGKNMYAIIHMSLYVYIYNAKLLSLKT